MTKKIIAYLLCFLLYIAATVSCGVKNRNGAAEDSESPAYMPSKTLDSLISTLNRLNQAGEHDSIVNISKPILYDALKKHDTLAAFYAGLFTAQSYQFIENLDSVKYYTDLISPLLEYPLSPNARMILNGILGNYSLRTSLDYSKALSYYIESLMLAEESGEINNQISLLSNIVNIFYIQKSAGGMKYAEQAYSLAASHSEASGYARIGSCIVMAQMLFVKGDYDTALKYIDEAKAHAAKGHYLSYISFICSMSAQIYQEKGDYGKAADEYSRAMESIRYSDPGTASQTYLQCGDFLAVTGDTLKAREMYRKGLDISDATGNIEYRQDLLGHLALLSFESDRYYDAARYSARYIVYSDSISNRMENEFQDLILSRMQAESAEKIMEKELENKNIQEKLLKRSFLLVVIIIFAVSVLLIYSRQRKMYRELAKRHQMYMNMATLDNKKNTSDKDSAMRKLFDQVEELMRNEKIYRMKNLTREVLAEKLGTNYYYLSKAVNTCAGMAFNRYVDYYRIKEAAGIISQSGSEVLFKQLADSLGYNSVTVFSKAFQREIGCSPSIYRKEADRRISERQAKDM